MSSRRLFVVLGILACLAPAALVGQDSQQSQSTLDEANDLVARLAELDGALALLRELAGQEATEDGDRVASRTASYATERRQVVWELSDVAGRLPSDSLAQQTAAFADSVLLAELERIEAEAVARSAEATGIRSSQADASPAMQLELQIRLNRLDGQIEQRISDYVETLERMEARGIGPPAIADRLDRFLLGRAELSIAEMDLASEDAETLERAIAAAGDASEADMRLRLEVARARFTDAAAALRALIDIMDRRGMETEDLNEELLVRSRDFTPESVDVRVLGLLARRFSSWVTAWISTHGSTALIRGLSIIAILFVFRVLAGLTRNLTRRAVATSRLNLSRLLQDTFVAWAGRAVMILGVLITLSQLGLDLGPVLAGLGVAGFIVGFALQDTLSNFASGMMILIYRPFDVDDLVEAGGQFGKVSALSLVSTTLLTIDNQRLVVPNSQIWGGVIRNVTAQHIRRVDLVFGIGYSDDIPKAEEVLKRIVAEHPKVLDDPEPVVKVHNLGDSSVDFVVRPWCQTDDYWDVHWDITKSVKMTFDAEGISIPFPQHDVHIHEAAAE